MDEVLNADDHGDTVAYFLISLSGEDVIALGEALGLNTDNLKKMKNMPGGMVDAWVKMKDNVFGKSGEPTWSSLVEALRSIKQTSLAEKIRSDIEGVGGPRPSSATTKTTSATPSGRVAMVGGEDLVDDTIQEDGGPGRASNVNRIEDDFKWPFGGKNKTKNRGEYEKDGGPGRASNINRIEDDFNWPFGGKNKTIHKPAKNRGEYEAQLRLDDEDDKITVIPPETSSHQPYSHRGFYSMKAKKHGVALIINNKEFQAKEHKARTGTDRDEQNLTETWQFLGYHVVIMRDCTRDEMARTFEKIDKLLKSADGVANDSFVCCILSHGREGEVFGSDSRPLEHTWIQRYLAKSDILRSRPKLLFIQACQGSSPGSEALSDRLKEIDSDDDTISEYTDFYLSSASVHGDRSYRDIYTGTWFISELCQTLCKRSMVMDLDEIQKEVNENVVIKYEFRDFKQQPRGIDQLRRKVFFFQQE